MQDKDCDNDLDKDSHGKHDLASGRHTLASPARRSMLRGLGVGMGAGAGIAMSGAAALLPALVPGYARAADNVDLSKVTLRVGDQTGATRGLFHAAGLLDKLPYQIEWSVFPAAVDLHEALKANATDIGASNDSPAVTAFAGGSPVKVVSAWREPDSTDTTLLTQQGSKIKTLQDLRGKTISPTTRGSVAHFLVVGLLKQAGIPLDQVKFAFLTPTDASAAFSSGSIDAWSTWGIFRARAQGSLHARVVDSGAHVNTGLSVLSAHPQALQDSAKRAAIAHFSALQDRAYAWGRANRDAYIDWYASFSRQDKAVVSAIYADNVGYKRIPVDGALVSRLHDTYQTWVDVGFLKPGLDVSSHVYQVAAA